MNVALATRNTKTSAGLKFEILTVTPEISAAWLDTTKRNRKINKRMRTNFARDMKARQWAVTGDAIKFSSKGDLLDGQHRLLACIDADTPFETLVIYGVDAAAQDVMDTGKARSSADMLSMHGVKNASHVAATYRVLVNERKLNAHSGGAAVATHSEIKAAMKKHPNLPLYVPQSGKFPPRISLSIVGYVNYVAATLLEQPVRAAKMIEVLATGVPDYDGDPIHRYRERVLRTDNPVGGSVERQARLWTLFHCWNLFAQNEPITLLKWRLDRVPIEGLDLKKL